MTLPESNGSIPQDACVMLGEIVLEELRRTASEAADKAFDELMEHMRRRANQRSVSLEQNAQQPRLALETDVTKDTMTCKRVEGAAAAQRVVSEDNPSAQVNTEPIRLTSFDDDFTGPPALPCSKNDTLVDNGAAAQTLCRSPAGMRPRTATGGLLPNGKASTATRTTFD